MIIESLYETFLNNLLRYKNNRSRNYYSVLIYSEITYIPLEFTVSGMKLTNFVDKIMTEFGNQST